MRARAARTVASLVDCVLLLVGVAAPEPPTPRAVYPLERSVTRADVPERYVTALIRLEDVDRDELARVLPRVRGDCGDLVVFPEESMIITDVESNIRRILSLVRRRPPEASAAK